MNRQINFRAWDKEDKKLFEPASRINAMTISITLNGEIVGHPNVGEMTDRFELMQSTGLKDKNGKEIYEGDVIKFFKDEKERIEVIEFRSFGFTVGKDMNFRLEQLQEYFNQMEIIGNISESPELLK